MKEQAYQLIHDSKNIVVMTGAGVSVPSGIPDYRSMTGVYHGIEEPEYLLSHSCLVKEPDKFYTFVQQLYHPEAKPNVIHEAIKSLESKHHVTVISQNIDGLHDAVGSRNVVNFHGTLYNCYCMSCGQSISVEAYLESDRHQQCGGQVRPDVVLYEEGLSEDNIRRAIEAMEEADLIMIIGTTFKVYPFSGLIQYRDKDSDILVINKEAIGLYGDHLMIEESAERFFNHSMFK